MFRIAWLAGAVVLCLVLMSGNSFSGGDKKDSGKLKGMLPDNWKRLNLSDEQKQKIYAVQRQFKAKVDQIMEQINQVKIEERTEMLKVLSDAQKALLRKLTLGDDTAPKKDGK